MNAYECAVAELADRKTEAEQLIVFCDGLEEGGLVDHARRGRRVAGLLIDTLEELCAERSARVALQGGERS